MTGPATANPPKADVRVRSARLGDIGAISRLYRSQSEESRHRFHPYPFGRGQLFAIFAFMVVSRPFRRRLLRWAPRRTVLLLVATLGPHGPVAGFGNVAFVRRDGAPKAIFGYLVEEAHRGLGIGTLLHVKMIDAALEVGVTRGGGMVVSDNVANLRILEKLGFSLRPSDLVDSGAPGSSNVETDGDLLAIASKWRGAAGPT